MHADRLGLARGAGCCAGRARRFAMDFARAPSCERGERTRRQQPPPLDAEGVRFADRSSHVGAADGQLVGCDAGAPGLPESMGLVGTELSSRARSLSRSVENSRVLSGASPRVYAICCPFIRGFACTCTSSVVGTKVRCVNAPDAERLHGGSEVSPARGSAGEGSVP